MSKTFFPVHKNYFNIKYSLLVECIFMEISTFIDIYVSCFQIVNFDNGIFFSRTPIPYEPIKFQDKYLIKSGTCTLLLGKLVDADVLA